MMKFFEKKRLFVLAALSLIIAGVNAETITEKFDNFNVSYASGITLPDGWDFYGSTSLAKGTEANTYKSKPSIAYEVDNKNAYLITPVLEGEFSFWLRNYTKSYQASVIAYACTYEDGKFDLGSEIDRKTLSKTTSGTPQFSEVKFTSSTATRVALLISTAYFDDFTYTPSVLSQGHPSLTVINSNKETFSSGDSYDFGNQPVPAGTEASFTLINGGDQDLTFESITVTGDFKITEGADLSTLTPNQSGVVKIVTPANNTEGKLEIVSNDTENSPFVINLKSTYKVPMPVMEVDVTTIQFGAVKEDTVREITICNSGDADLVVTITSNNDEFKVSQTTLTVEPESSETFEVTFIYSEKEFGEHKATISIQPEKIDGVSIEVSAIVKDPSIWEEDFESGEMPPYWSTDGWSVTKHYPGNGTYMAYAGITSGPILTTPRLAAKEGEKLTFEVGGGIDSTDVLTIKYSHDLITWTELDPVEETGMHIFTAPEEGYYYLRFSGRYSALDNFSGFRLALKEHDLSLQSQNVPADGHQYIEYTATVKVREMLGKEETAQAHLIIDGKKIAESEAKTLAPNGVEEFILTFTPEESLKEVEAKIVVNYSEGESISSDPVILTIAPAVVLSDEDTEFELSGTTYPSVVFSYTPVAGWNTITFPFVPTEAIFKTIFGEDCKVFEFRGFDAGDGVASFDYPTFLAAGYAYVVKAPSVTETPVSIKLKDARITSTTGSDEHNGVKFFGLYTPLSDADDTVYVVNKEGNLEELADNATVKAYHGYMTLPSTVKGIPVLNFKGEEGNSTIESIGEKDACDSIYDLQGRKLAKVSRPGLYIINGKKVIVK